MKRIEHPWIAGLMLALAVVPCRAESNSNYLFNAISTNFGGPFTVGSGASATNNRLVISNGGAVTNTTGTLGTGGGARNAAFVTNTGSRWVNLGDLTVGATAAESKSNSVTVADGGFVFSTNALIGSVGSYNSALVSGSGSVWSNVLSFTVGGAGTAPEFNTLIVSNGGTVVSASGVVGSGGGARNNQIILTGVNSLWTNSGNFTVGTLGKDNQLLIQDDAQLHNALGYIGSGAAATNNSVWVAGDGALWNNTDRLYVGDSGAGNRLVISNGALVISRRAASQASGIIGNAASSSNNLVIVTGSGSLWSNTSFLIVGHQGNGTMIVADGGEVVSAGSGASVIGNQAASTGSIVRVTGAGSTWNAMNDLEIGVAGAENRLIITNGGLVSVAGRTRVGVSASSAGNLVLITGTGSMLQSGGIVSIGSNGVTSGSGSHIRVTDGGTLEANTMAAGLNGSGSISNIGGVFQFTTAAPVITNNTAGAISIHGGAISFRGITNADVSGSLGGNDLANLRFSGDNIFRLNQASNWSANAQNYTFAAGNPSNYAGLEMIHGATAWRSAWLAFGADGTMLISNSSATVAGTISNAGVIRIVNSTVTWQSNAVVGGRYMSDPSTNIFAGTLTVDPSGALQGGNGDLFVFQKDLALSSTNRVLHDLSSAAMRFTNATGGGTNHVLDLSGGSALDLGSNFASVAELATNFSLGQLQIGAGNRLQLTGAVVNAFYVGALDLGGLDTNALASVLDLDVNLYYDPDLADNAYLSGLIYDFDGWSGALIPLGIPIPEASALPLVLLGAAALGMTTRRKRRRATASNARSQNVAS